MNFIPRPGEPKNARELEDWLQSREAMHKGNPPPLTPREYMMVRELRGKARPEYSLT